MEKIRNFLISTLGIVLAVVGYGIRLLFIFPAAFVLDLPIWLILILLAIIVFVPIIGPLLNIALWIWAFVVCLNSPVSTLSVFFYIMFALNALDFIQATLRAIFTRDK